MLNSSKAFLYHKFRNRRNSRFSSTVSNTYNIRSGISPKMLRHQDAMYIKSPDLLLYAKPILHSAVISNVPSHLCVMHPTLPSKSQAIRAYILSWRAKGGADKPRPPRVCYLGPNRLDGISDSMGMSLSELRELAMDREAWCAAITGLQRVRHNWVTGLNRTELNW